LFPFGEDVFMPGESSVEVLDLFCLRELDIVDVNRGTQIPLRVVNVMCVDLDPLAFSSMVDNILENSG
jgi:hypothetical protein